MDYDELPLWIRMFNDWLMGMTIEERIKNLPKGKLEMCIKCGEIFFDLETPEQRRWVSCFTLYSKHECRKLENYIILIKPYRSGVLAMVTYQDSEPMVDAICEFFKKCALGKYHEIVKHSRSRF